MKIGVDATPLQIQLTGVGHYVFSLLEELLKQHPEDTFYLYSIRSSPTLEQLAQYPNVVLRTHPFFSFSEALWSQTTLCWMSYKDRLDLFWGVTQSLPFLTRKTQKNVLTIHDFAYLLYPKTVSIIRGTYLRLFAEHFYRKADTILTNSQGTFKKLQRFCSLNADGVIIPPVKKYTPANVDATLTYYHLRKNNYYLMVGTLEPRKNILQALKAYCELQVSNSTAPLVLTGKSGWRMKQIQKELKKIRKNYPYQIYQLGYVPDEQLAALIKGAKAYLMPSLYEGYGMPIAEARSLGTPVICMDTPEMRDAAEGDAQFINPGNFKAEFQRALLFSLKKPKQCSYPSGEQLAKNLFNYFNKK